MSGMGVRRRYLSVAIALSLLVAGGLGARAAVVPYGAVLIPGASWAGSLAALGDLNVYSNGDGSTDQWGTYGLNYECVELATRYVALRYSVSPWSWRITYAYQMWAAGPKLTPTPFVQLPNGGAVPPQFGDLLIFDKTTGDPAGHVAIVRGTGPGYVDIVEQNWDNPNPTGYARLPISGTTMPPRADGFAQDPGGLPILGWLRAYNEPAGVEGTVGPGGYTLDSFGGVHPYGSAVPLSQPDRLPAGLARGVVEIPPAPGHSISDGGYTLDAYGGIHHFGNAPPVAVTGYWPGWDIARGIVLASDGHSGFVLDGFGGLHPFAAAGSRMPTVPHISGYWAGWDIARGLVMLPGSDSAGYVLDGWGGIHPFGSAPGVKGTGYWPGWDIARGVAIDHDGLGGYVVDGFNGVHPFGNAPGLATSAYFGGQDVARGIVAVQSGGGYTVTAWGKVHGFGPVPPVDISATFPDPVARGLAG